MSDHPTLIATSVVRGSQQGDSHGGIYLIDFAAQTVSQKVDWNTANIDFSGRGWDRGLRGIEFDDDDVYIAASDELFAYDPDFRKHDSWRNPYLRHAHEISRFGRNLFITSTGFDSVLAFDLDKKKFTWGLNIVAQGGEFHGWQFDPGQPEGPAASNRYHINNVYCDDTGMYISGRGTGALLRFGGRDLSIVRPLPAGVHNARPFGDGVIYNDSENDRVCMQSSGSLVSFDVPGYAPDELTHTDIDDSALARQRFGRGLCVVDGEVIAAGSSPSTVSIYDFADRRSGPRVNLTMDIRNAIHGLEVWPF